MRGRPSLRLPRQYVSGCDNNPSEFIGLCSAATFKADRASLGRLLDEMRATPVIDIEKNYVYDEGVFEDRLVERLRIRPSPIN
jgi:hypothetical protein